MIVSILSLIATLSLDVARNLCNQGLGLGFDTDVAASTSSGSSRFTATPAPVGSTTATPGLPYPPLAIVACTGIAVSPIVITTAYPHGISTRGVGGMSCVIVGITGNLAANNIDADPRSRTIGLPAGIIAVPTGPTTLALYGQDFVSGAIVPIAGSGAYTGGGSIAPALTDGSILIGRDTARENTAPPRIVIIPRKGRYSSRSGSIPFARAEEERRQISQRAIRTEREVWDVMCWGQATPPDPARDYDATKALAHAVIDSAHLLFGATNTDEEGVWLDEKERATQQIKAGHAYTFGLVVAVPVLDNALPYAPSGTVIIPTTRTQTPDGTVETGCMG